MTDYDLSHHAIRRREEMGLDDDTIRDLLFNPDITRNARDSDAGHECRIFRRGELAAVIDMNDHIVLTFLPATPEAWEQYERPDRKFRRDDWFGHPQSG